MQIVKVAFSLLALLCPTTTGFSTLAPKPAAENGKNNIALDPKAKLVSLIVSGLKSSDSLTSGAAQSEELETIVSSLEAKGKGYNSGLVDGDWAIVLSRQGDKSANIQKLVEKKEKANMAFSNFAVKDMKFFNENYTPRRNGKLEAVVKYEVSSKGFTKTADGKIVLRRVMCDIVDASFKYWKLPRIPLPIRAKGGYLDFLYLDEDIRVTRGNRGGLFVHFRPEYLEKVLQ